MERVGDSTYRCTVCGGMVQVGADETPVAMVVAQSGKANERIVKVGDVEVHRCTFSIDRQVFAAVNEVR